jgi:hypothetical protein
MASNSVALTQSRAKTHIMPPPQSNGVGFQSSHRAREVRTVQEDSSSAVTRDATMAIVSHARSLRTLPLHLLRPSSWATQSPVVLGSAEIEALLNTLRVNSEACGVPEVGLRL